MSVPQKNFAAGITSVRVLIRPMDEQVPVVSVPSFTGNHQTFESIDRPNLDPDTACRVNGSHMGVCRCIIAAIPAGSAACGREEAHQDENWKQIAAPTGQPVGEGGRYWDRTSDLCRVKAALSR